MAIKAKNLSFSYRKKKVLENLNFEIKDGEFIAILGPNGAGKTTLLKCILGLLKVEGEILVFGKDPSTCKKILEMISYVPQKSTLSTDLPITVIDVLRMNSKELNEEIIEDFELCDKMKTLFRELSGGFQQRVLIARALMKNPKMILLDEPFNGVDVLSQEKITKILEKVNATVLAVVHNINPIIHAVDRVMLLNRELIAFGKPNDVFTKENLFKAYKAEIPVVICEEGIIHPLYGDQHG
ncbi:MAG: metal ABC transporter ATP-binding protein [Archaeoglobaceae archaeon]|nr:metal ABC transporter ATP-binding protein [Archaeoglobaceae archaeon]MDW7990317.1 metal ABC transporter ATP-binding protein [Archaeoglobaceae archaeon]